MNSVSSRRPSDRPPFSVLPGLKALWHYDMIRRKVISLRENREVLVIGSATYDICGHLSVDTIPGDSNPGTVSGSCGGVGRNIAENMARMGLSVSLLTTFGEDSFSAILKDSCRKCGIDYSGSFFSKDYSSNAYLSVIDKNGELLVAASDHELFENMPVEALQRNAEYIADFPNVFLDANLTDELLECAAALSKGRVFADAVSVAKAVRLKSILQKIDTLKVNRAELSAISGLPAETQEEVLTACDNLLGKGVQRIFVTMGLNGCCCADAAGYTAFPAFPAKVVNVTGAGDAFAAGIVYSAVKDLPVKDTLRLCTAASHIALEAPCAVNERMSERSLMEVYDRFSIET